MQNYGKNILSNTKPGENGLKGTFIPPPGDLGRRVACKVRIARKARSALLAAVTLR